jgi:hypothetical protein
MKKIFALTTFGLTLYAPSMIASETVYDDVHASSVTPFDPSSQTTAKETASAELENPGLLIETLKTSNYDSMTLEEVQKVLQKKQELAKALEGQLRVKETRDQQKRSLLDKLQRLDEENKKKLLELKQPFKR